MVAVSSPQSPPVDPKYQMEAFLEFVNAAPLPLNSKPNVSNMVVEPDAGESEKAGGRIQHLSSDSLGQVAPDQ